MCSILLTTLAVPCGFVNNCEHELNCSANSTCCLHRRFPHLHFYNYGSANYGTQGQTDQTSSSSLPDLVMSHIPPASSQPSTGTPIMPSSSDAMSVPSTTTATNTLPPNKTKSSHKASSPSGPRLLSTSSSSFWSCHRTKQSTRKRKTKIRSRDSLVPQREMCPPCSNSVPESIRHILDVRHKFPEHFHSPSRRQEYCLSWDSLQFHNNDFNCLHCEVWDECWDCSPKEDWLKVGSQLRRIADDFKFNSSKSKTSSSPNFDSTSVLQNFVARCLLFSFIGIFALRVYCKFR